MIHPTGRHETASAYDATIGLGSNIGDKAANLDEAIRRLTAAGDIRLVQRSRTYRSAPWGVTDQDEFANACISVATEIAAGDLLKRCQQVESDMGRVRLKKWGPRVIDIDILTYRDLTIQEPDLIVPHPLIAERNFVLVPLKDVAPNLKVSGVTLDALIARTGTRDLEAIM